MCYYPFGDATQLAETWNGPPDFFRLGGHQIALYERILDWRRFRPPFSVMGRQRETSGSMPRPMQQFSPIGLYITFGSLELTQRNETLPARSGQERLFWFAAGYADTQTAHSRAKEYHSSQGWQVLGEAPTTWIPCESKEDTELIAGFEALCCEVFDGRASGEDVAAVLDAMAEAVVRNIGHGTSERFIRHAAKRARGET